MHFQCSLCSPHKRKDYCFWELHDLHSLFRCSRAFYVIHILLYAMLRSGDVYCPLFQGFCFEFAISILNPITTILLEERILQVNVGFSLGQASSFKIESYLIVTIACLVSKGDRNMMKVQFLALATRPSLFKISQAWKLIYCTVLVNTCYKLTANQTAHGFPVLVFFRPPRLSLSVGQKATMDHTAGQMQCLKVATNRNSVCLDSAHQFLRIYRLCLNPFWLRISSDLWTFINSNT